MSDYLSPENHAGDPHPKSEEMYDLLEKAGCSQATIDAACKIVDELAIEATKECPRCIDQYAADVSQNTTSFTVRTLVDRIESLRALLVKSHTQLLRLVTTFVSDRDSAHRQTCDLMREIREACPQDKFAGGSDE